MRWFRVVVLVTAALMALSAQAQQPSKSGDTPPLYMQADQLIYDTRGNRVIAQGSVEIYYNNYILTADQVTYDQSANTLVAEGNAQLKDPDGSITRADRFDAPADFRDAFVQSLSAVTEDNKRIVPAPR